MHHTAFLCATPFSLRGIPNECINWKFSVNRSALEARFSILQEHASRCEEPWFFDTAVTVILDSGLKKAKGNMISDFSLSNFT